MIRNTICNSQESIDFSEFLHFLLTLPGSLQIFTILRFESKTNKASAVPLSHPCFATPLINFRDSFVHMHTDNPDSNIKDRTQSWLIGLQEASDQLSALFFFQNWLTKPNAHLSKLSLYFCFPKNATKSIKGVFLAKISFDEKQRNDIIL